jgi:hypothetical protein
MVPPHLDAMGSIVQFSLVPSLLYLGPRFEPGGKVSLRVVPPHLNAMRGTVQVPAVLFVRFPRLHLNVVG